MGGEENSPNIAIVINPNTYNNLFEVINSFEFIPSVYNKEELVFFDYTPAKDYLMKNKTDLVVLDPMQLFYNAQGEELEKIKLERKLSGKPYTYLGMKLLEEIKSEESANKDTQVIILDNDNLQNPLVPTMHRKEDFLKAGAANVIPYSNASLYIKEVRKALGL